MAQNYYASLQTTTLPRQCNFNVDASLALRFLQIMEDLIANDVRKDGHQLVLDVNDVRVVMLH